MRKKFGYLSDVSIYIVIFILLAITPLLLKYMVVTNVQSEFALFQGHTYDIFVYFKSMFVKTISIICFIYFLIKIIYDVVTKKFNVDSLKNPLLFGCLLVIVFTLISDYYSKYKDVVLAGVNSRYESVFIGLGYIFIMATVAMFANTQFKLKCVLFAITFGAFFIGVVGTSQFINYCTPLGKTGNWDLMITPFFEKLYLGSLYNPKAISAVFTTVYSTLYNPNYVGMYGSMYLPLGIFTVISCNRRSFLKYFSIVTCLLMIPTTIGSNSLAGFIALAFSLVFSIVLYGLYVKKIYKNKKIIIGVIISLASFIILPIVSYMVIPQVHTLGNKFYNKAFNQENYYSEFKTDANSLIIKSKIESISLTFSNIANTVKVIDGSGKVLASDMYMYNRDAKNILFVTPHGIHSSMYVIGNLVQFGYNGMVVYVEKKDGKVLVSKDGSNPTDINIPYPSIGFKGHENFASNRGYIWSRSIPIALKSVVKGSGSDTFALVFPQGDFVGKLLYLQSYNIIVDKPHNVYLQYAINTGVFSLVGYLVICLYIMIINFRNILDDSGEYENDRFYIFMQMGVVISIFAYLVNGLSVDQNILVSPTFFSILGIGYSLTINRRISKKVNKATIDK